MSNWTDRDPGAGDRSAGISASSKVTALNTSVTTLSSALDIAISGTGSDVWASSAGDAFREGLQQPKSIAAQLIANFGTVSAALSAYATAVGSIKDSQQRAEDAYNTARNNWARWMATQQCDPDQRYMGLPPTPPLTVEDAAVRGVPVLGHHTEFTMRDAMNSFRGLVRTRTEADDALVAALAPPAGWADTRKALAAAGITNVKDLSNRSIADAFAEYAAKMTQGDLSPEDLANLKTFLERWGGDSTTMSRFYLGLGGDKTVELIDQLGSEVVSRDLDPNLAITLASLIRSGLSVGSANWASGTAKRFAEEMTTYPHGARAAIGFLFSDPTNARLGEELAVAMANFIDAKERGVDGQPWTDHDVNSGGRVLATIEEGLTGRPGYAVNDVAGRVFTTLGQYPDAAFDWLTNPKNGDERVEYWFGERDWSAETSGDGFEGPAALWNGALQIPGGFSDKTFYDEEAWRASSRLTTLIVENLTGNSSYLPENVSEIGSITIAGAINQALPIFLEYPVHFGEASDVTRGVGIGDVLGLGDRPIPVISKEQLAQLLGGAFSSDLGTLVIAGGIGEYENSVTDLFNSGGRNGTEAIDSILDSQALLSGVPDGTDRAIAERLDANREAALEMLQTLVGGAIPGNYAVSVGSDIGLGLLTETIFADWTGNHAEVLEAQLRGETVSLAQQRALIEDLYARFGSELSPETLLSNYEDSKGNYILKGQGD